MKKLLGLLIICILTTMPAFANNSNLRPVKIIPAENISTAYDEIQVGDKLMFKAKNDVYGVKNPQQLLIKKGTPIIGYVSFFQENGWANDNAEIQLNKFQFRNAEGKLVTLNSEVTIDGFELLKNKANRPAQFFNYIGVIFRGKEIDFKYGIDDATFTIWVAE